MKKRYSILLLVLLVFNYTVAKAQSCQQKHDVVHFSKSGSSDFVPMASNLRSDTVDILNYSINLNITDFTTNVIKGNTKVKFTPKVNAINKIELDLLELILD